MHVPAFTYHRPATVQDAGALLASLPGEVAVLAGGTEMLVELKSGKRWLDHLVSLDALEQLREIRADGGGLFLGALVTAGALARSETVRARFPELVEVSDVFAARQVGNRATIGGNIAAAVPSADFPPILIALHATVEIAGPAGTRTIPLEQAFAGPRKSSLKKGELITGIRLPAKLRGFGAAYVKFGLRNAGACCVAGVAASVRLDGGLCVASRIVIGAVAPTPLLVAKASDVLNGRVPDEKVLDEAAAQVQQASAPISDIRGSLSYRHDIIRPIAVRAIRAAVARAKAN